MTFPAGLTAFCRDAVKPEKHLLEEGQPAPRYVRIRSGRIRAEARTLSGDNLVVELGGDPDELARDLYERLMEPMRTASCWVELMSKTDYKQLDSLFVPKLEVPVPLEEGPPRYTDPMAQMADALAKGLGSVTHRMAWSLDDRYASEQRVTFDAGYWRGKYEELHARWSWYTQHYGPGDLREEAPEHPGWQVVSEALERFEKPAVIFATALVQRALEGRSASPSTPTNDTPDAENPAETADILMEALFELLLSHPELIQDPRRLLRFKQFLDQSGLDVAQFFQGQGQT